MTMKRILTVLLLLPAAAFAQKGFRIQGNIEALKDSTEIRLSFNNNTPIAVALSKGGKFELAGEVAEPQLTMLTIGSEKPVYLYIENSTMTLTAPAKEQKTVVKTGAKGTTPGSKTKTETRMPDLTRMKVDGSQAQVDFIQFQNAFMPQFNQINQLVTKANSAADPGERDRTVRAFDSVKRLVDQLVEQYITAKPASYVSPFVLVNTAELLDNAVALDERFRRLDTSVQQSSVGKYLASMIAQKMIGAIGSEAADFTQADTTGKPVALSSLRGKYVLLDFWASWCRPCRAENPNVVRAYQKFQSKNFTILAVSLDQSKDAWINAIHADRLTWTHVSDLQQWNNAVARMYGVQGIPQNFLIDPNGRIVGKNLRGEDLERKLCELLGCN
ncbi:MAG: AhpC/TSA family protein [Chitinophagaceae bacterium]|nr:MAG: AhpC/TSA family protein [Chitinophagaceae bacterium]